MRRVAFLCAALVAAGVSASVAGAAPPTSAPYSFSGPLPLPGVCSFDVALNVTTTGTETFFLDSDGALRIGLHATEVDTFNANGVTLVGEPYTYNIQAVIDANGNLVSEYLNGGAETIVLPDGTVFHTAGRTNSLVWPLNNPGGPAILPEFGSQGNVAAFCAALS